MSTRKNENILVSEVMLELGRIPVVPERMIFKEALEEMGKKRLGIACVVDDDGKLKGIITDGDIRRKLLNVQKPFSAFLIDDAIDHAIRTPTVVAPELSLLEAITKMEVKQVWDLPVVDHDGTLLGLLHLHPVVKLLLEQSN